MTHLAHYAQIKSLIRQRLNPVAAQILGGELVDAGQQALAGGLQLDEFSA